MKEKIKRSIIRFMYRVLWGNKINGFVFIPLDITFKPTEVSWKTYGMLMNGLHPFHTARLLMDQVNAIMKEQYIVHDVPDVLKKMEKQFEK